MVTSLMLKGMYKVGISQSGKIKLPDGTIVELKNIPFVRYRFDKYGDTEIGFILENMKSFPCTHVVEVKLDENTRDIIERLTDIGTVGKIVYVDVTDTEVKLGFNKEQLLLLETLRDLDIDRLTIRDNSTTLDNLAVTRLKKDIKEVTGIPVKEIGVCGGPCCFGAGEACLTALKAREIAAKYAVEGAEDKSPSSNHQGKQQNVDEYADCVNKCGCIRYYIITSDLPAPASRVNTSADGETSGKSAKTSKKPKEDSEKKETAPKEKKVPKRGRISVAW